MKISKILLLSLGCFLSSCSADINNLISKDVKKSISESNLLSSDEVKNFDEMYSGFKTQAVTQSYLDKKIRALASQSNDLPLLKEIAYARLKHSTVLKNIICTDNNLYTQITSVSKTNINARINSDPIFANYITQLNCSNYNKILFQSTRDDTTNSANIYARNWEIYTMNPDGTNQTRITNLAPSGERHPAWSADKTKITFTSNLNPVNEIYTIDGNGSNRIRLTSLNVDTGVSVYSPDGSKIAFQTTKDGNWEIYTMNSNGTNLLRITNNSFNDYVPAWSPDGSKIIFTSNRDGDYDIYTVSSNGSNLTNLTNNTSNESLPRFSPDGTKIAFFSDKDGDSEIYTMNSDGTNVNKLTNNSFSDENPTWSPDGTKIAFQSNRDGNSEIYVMNSDGTSQTRLTNNAKEDWYPYWAN